MKGSINKVVVVMMQDNVVQPTMNVIKKMMEAESFYPADCMCKCNHLVHHPLIYGAFVFEHTNTQTTAYSQLYTGNAMLK